MKEAKEMADKITAGFDGAINLTAPPAPPKKQRQRRRHRKRH